MFITAIASLTVLHHDFGPAALVTADIVGIVGWSFGMGVEVMADMQKSAWRARPENKAKNHWIEEGLWASCRHPNYFGEIVIWSSVLLIATQSLRCAITPNGNGQSYLFLDCAANDGTTVWAHSPRAAGSPTSAWAAAVSPFFVALLLLHVSGIPLLAKINDKKWGGDAGYKAHLVRAPIRQADRFDVLRRFLWLPSDCGPTLAWTRSGHCPSLGPLLAIAGGRYLVAAGSRRLLWSAWLIQRNTQFR